MFSFYLFVVLATHDNNYFSQLKCIIFFDLCFLRAKSHSGGHPPLHLDTYPCLLLAGYNVRKNVITRRGAQLPPVKRGARRIITAPGVTWSRFPLSLSCALFKTLLLLVGGRGEELHSIDQTKLGQRQGNA